MTVIKSKLLAPRHCGKLLARPRLQTIVDRDQPYKLVFVNAPAGFGKSTLLYQWRQVLLEKNVSVAWYTLDDSDNDPITFGEHFFASLEFALTDSRQAPAGKSPLAERWKNISHPISLITNIVNEVIAVERDIVLVLDDFHCIAEKGVIRGMRKLLEYAPPNLHFIIASRSQPQFSIASWLAHGEAIALDAQQLRFNASEIDHYLAEIQQISLRPEDGNQLREKTEGWAAGLHMASLAIKQMSPGELGGVNIERGSQSLRGYLAEQVFDKQPDEIKSFLLKTAFLPRLTADLCNEVVGITNAENILTEIVKGGLFIVPLEDNGFRYHHSFSALLKDYLRDYAASKHPALISELIERACHWFEKNNYYLETVTHALQGEAFDIAERYIEQYGMDLLKKGMTTTLLSWVEQLPKPVNECAVTLQLPVAWSLILVRRPDEAQAILANIDQQNGGADERLAIHTEIARYTALAWQEGPIEAKSRMQEIYATGLVDDSWDIAAVHNIIIYGCSLDGDIMEATKAYQKVLLVADNPYSIVYAKVLMGMCLKARGQLHEAAKLFEDALHIAADDNRYNDVTASLAASNLAEIFYEWNDLAACKDVVGSRMDTVDETSLNDVLVSVYASMVRIKDYEDSYGEATKLIQHGLELSYSQSYGHLLEAALLHEKSRLLLARGSLDEVVDLVAYMETRFAQEFSSESFIAHQVRAYVSLCKAELYAQQHHFDKAVALTDALIEWEQGFNRHYDVIKLQGFKAATLFLDNKRAEAFALLDSALSAAAPHGIIRSFIDLGKPFGELLLAYLAQTSSSALNAEQKNIDAAYLDRLRQALVSEEKKPVSRSLNEGGPSSRSVVSYGLSERQQKIVVCIAQGLSNKQIAAALNISVDTVKWHVKQIFQKFDVRNRAEVARKAQELNMMRV